MTLLGLMLQGGTFSFGELLANLEAMDFFRFVLPFLLIFAVSYAVLTRIPVFEKNKGAAAVVAFAAGLLALQFDVVPAFFQNVFPKFGIAIALLLIALILAGVFITEEKAYKWIFFGIGALMFLLIIIISFSDWQFVGYWWWQQYGTLIVVLVIVIAAIVAVLVSSGKSKT